MNYFWVNQGKTYNDESLGGYLWAPQYYTKKNGTNETPHHWKSIELIEIGDIIINYNKKEGGIIGYCIAKSNYYEANKPEFKNDEPEENWNDEGYLVDAKYISFKNPLELSKIYDEIESLFPDKYSPVANKDRVNQGYLFQISEILFSAIISKSKNQLVSLEHHKKDYNEKNTEISVKFQKIKTIARKINSKRKAGEIVTESEVDHIGIAKKKHIKGKEAEEFVFEQEKKKLMQLNKANLAKKVMNKSHQLGLGYDILSFDEDGTEKHIEVKASNSNQFYISDNELEVSKNDPNYFIYIVQVNRQKTNYIIKEIKNPQFLNNSKFTLTPKDFLVSFKAIAD
tara:strand:+ start:71 stop:1093 length:1023 start_codon:yes stop_codon:yes gene_type:complete